MTAFADQVATDPGAEHIETVVVTGVRKNLLDDLRNGTMSFADQYGVEVISGRRGIESFLLRGRSDFNLVINHVLATPYSGVSLDDTPPEMIKSITVYHARSADMDEGGGAGTIEVALKKPLDCNPGFSAAGTGTTGVGSTRQTASGLWYGQVSWLTAYRGTFLANDLGVLLSGQYSHDNRFALGSETGVPVAAADQYGVLPAAIAAAETFESVSYSQSSNRSDNLTLKLAAQWRHGAFSVDVDGSVQAWHGNTLSDALRIYTADSSSTVTDYATDRTGAFLSDVTTTTTANTVNGGPDASLIKGRMKTQNLNIFSSWEGNPLSVTGYAYLTHTKNDNHTLEAEMRFADVQTATTDFSPIDRAANGPLIRFADADVLNPDSYAIRRFTDTDQTFALTMYSGALNVNYAVSGIPVLKRINAGYEVSGQETKSRYDDRYATLYGDDTQTSYLPMTSLGVCTGRYGLIRHGAVRNVQWYSPSMRCLASHYADFVDYLADGVADGAFVSADDWTDARMQNDGNQSRFDASTHKHAVFVQAAYELSSPLQLSGLLGLRAVYETLNFHRVGETDSSTATRGSDGYVSYIPNASLTATLTDRLSVQLDYTYNIETPSAQLYLGTGTIDRTSKVIYRGYSPLRPQTEQDYNAALTYQTGPAQTVSLKYFRNGIHGKPYTSGVVDTDAASSTYGYTIYATRNSGHGRYEGVEFSLLQTMDFLPGIWRDFGVDATLDWMSSYRMTYPYGVKYAAQAYQTEMVSRASGSVGLFYDGARLGANVSYRFKGRYRLTTDQNAPLSSPYAGYSASLNAQLNYYCGRHLTLKLRGYNLLDTANRSTWGVHGPFRGIDLTERKIALTISVM